MNAYSQYMPAALEWASVLPAHWGVERIKRLLYERKENNLPVKTTEILSLTNTKGVIPYSEKGNIGNKSKDKIEDYHLAYPNDLVLNSMNVVIGSVGVSKYFGAISPVYYALVSRGGMNIRYCEYIFRLSTFEETLKGLGNGILDIRKRIPMVKLNNVLFPVPPVGEQDQIVRYLDWKVSSVNRLINHIRKRIDLFALLKQKAIEDTIGHCSAAMVKLKHISSCNTDVLSENTAPDYVFRYIDIGAVDFVNGVTQYKTMRFVNAPSRARRVVRKNDIIISTVRTYLRAIAKITDDYDVVVSTGFAVIRPRPDMVESGYIEYYCKSDTFCNEVIRQSNGVAYPAIKPSALMNIKIPCPPLRQQRELAEKIEERCKTIDRAIDSQRARIDLLQALKTRLISDAVTGRIDVRDVVIPDYEYTEEEADEAAEEMEMIGETEGDA